jgi:hypothetical protein
MFLIKKQFQIHEVEGKKNSACLTAVAGHGEMRNSGLE